MFILYHFQILLNMKTAIQTICIQGLKIKFNVGQNEFQNVHPLYLICRKTEIQLLRAKLWQIRGGGLFVKLLQ